MPLELRRNKRGGFRNTWYGRFEVGGKRQCVSLGVRVQGTPPSSLRDIGDPAFERSRAKAQAKLDEVLAEARSRTDAIRLVAKTYELKTGESLSTTPVQKLAEEWRGISRKRKPSEGYLKSCCVILDRFVAYLRDKHPLIEEIGQITRNAAKGFLDAEAERNVSPRTWNESRNLLCSAMRNLLPAGYTNHFEKIPPKELDTVYRAPYSPEELAAIMEACQDDDFIRPIIVTGMCTAMRRGDCCQLKWTDVDLPGRFISVKTSKTRQTVTIPILPLLLNELENRPHGGQYVFPEQAEMYRTNPDGITYRFKKVLRKAGFVDAETAKEIESQPDEDAALPAMADDELRKKADAAIKASAMTNPKKARMQAILTLYLDGKTMEKTAEEVGCGKGTVSAHLNQVEQLVSATVVRRSQKDSPPAIVRGTTDAERPNGLHRASIRDFHSFRVTWVTLALTAGVPVELVTRVTGHKTIDVVLKHYFQPGREEFRNALQAAMPDLLMGGDAGPSPLDEMEEILDTTSSETWEQDVVKLRSICKKLSEGGAGMSGQPASKFGDFGAKQLKSASG